MHWLRSDHSRRQSTSLRLAYTLGFAVALGPTAAVTWAHSCPLSQVESNTLPPLLVNAKTMRRTQPDVVSYTSKVARDDDGAPNAYHRGNADASMDPGLDHICVGGSVLEFVDNRLYNRYGDGGSVGELGGIDRKSGASRSQMCKEDYITIRDAGFPECGPGQLCMIWYGIAAEPRACGYPSSFGKASDKRCGIPIRQLDSQKRPSNYYLTTTALRRPGVTGTSRVQADYVDAAKVPYIVLPGKMKLPVDTPWAVGDLAVVVWKGSSVYAVVGDTGPSDKLGEASRAVLAALHGGKSVAPIDGKDPATTLIFPGTAHRLQGSWPLSAADIDAEGKKLVEQAGGAAALSSCPGLSGLR